LGQTGYNLEKDRRPLFDPVSQQKQLDFAALVALLE
jgi:hypothetical protein